MLRFWSQCRFFATSKPRFQWNFKSALEEVRKHPGEYMSSFLILHEVTAIVPIPIFYFALNYFNFEYPVEGELLETGNKRMKKMLEFFGVDVEVDSKQMLHWVSAYVIVKTLMPLRIGLSLYLTPIGARFIRYVNPFKKSLYKRQI
jgi:hypothetical protein